MHRTSRRGRAFIHIGLAKTGTKSIQFALARQRSKLASAGWHFPKAGTSTHVSGHHGLAWHLQRVTHRHPALRRFNLDTFRAVVMSVAGDDLVISSEELSVLWSDENSIRCLLALFPEHDVFVVAYVREQSELLNSMYTQVLGNLRSPGSIGAFVARALERDEYNYLRMFGTWHRILGERLLIRPFDRRELWRGDVVEDFYHLLGIEDVVRPLATEHKNKQSNRLQVAVLLGLVHKLESLREDWKLYSDRHRFLRKVVSDILEDAELSTDETYWGIGPAWVKRIREHYRASNDLFFSRIAGRPFTFSNAGQIRARNAIAYAELPAALRARVQGLLLDGLARAPEEATELQPQGITTVTGPQ